MRSLRIEEDLAVSYRHMSTGGRGTTHYSPIGTDIGFGEGILGLAPDGYTNNALPADYRLYTLVGLRTQQSMWQLRSPWIMDCAGHTWPIFCQRSSLVVSSHLVSAFPSQKERSWLSVSVTWIQNWRLIPPHQQSQNGVMEQCSMLLEHCC